MSTALAERLRRPPSSAEIAIAAAALVVLAAAVFGPHVGGWGFFSDDWADAAGRYYPPGGESFSHVMDYFSSTFSYRPVLVVFTPLKYFLLGDDMSLQLTWTVLLGVAISTLLYGILRTLGVPWMHAGAIAALALVYPWFDSTRLWESANPAPLSIALALSGFWVALAGLSRRSWRLHAVALALYLISVLAYELTLPLILAAGLVYTLRAGWRAARMRWAADVCVLLAGGLWVGTHTTRSVSGPSAYFHHGREIVEGGGTLLARTLIPVGENSHTGPLLVLAALLLAGGLAVYLFRRPPAEAQAGWGLRQWLLLALAGLCVAALGWAIFIPADPYYTPVVFGVTNRVNGLAGYGLVIFAYGTIGVVFSALGELVPPGRRYVPVAVVLAAVLLGVAYLRVLDRHIGLWESAYASQRDAIATMKERYPTLPEGTTVFTSGYPAYETVGVPIFAALWDMSGMIKLEYEDGSLSAYPMLEGMSLACRRRGVALVGPGAPATAVPYGKARFLDLGNGQATTPRTWRRCRSAAPHFVPGPTSLQSGY
ncbi:MAG: hypothetical protein ACJ76D_06620 [Solirubrobacterales bacterium]